jgi:OOP family OmpA-OmpF porin
MRKTYPRVPSIKKTALALFVSALILPVSAHAEIKEGSVELSPFVGYNFFESQQNLKDDFVYGGRLGYNITPHFGIEGVGEFTQTKVDDRAARFADEGQFTSPIDKVKITRYHLDLLYHFMPEKNFNPFIAIGYGFAHYNPEINSRDMAIFDLGVGAKYWVADNIALRADLRDHLIYDERIHDMQATFGIVFAFGGKSTPPPAVARYEPKPQPVVVAKAEPKPEPKPTPPPPVVAKKVVILASEPEVEKKVQEVVAPPKADKVLFEEAEPTVVVLAFEDVHFDFDQSTLRPQTQTILKRNIQLLKDNPKAKIRIAGYTSASGTDEYNQKLSERRAQAVKDYLIGEGIIVSDRLSTIGYGEEDPANFEAAPKELYSPEAKSNMRVLFEIVVQ